ncbi:hypothetical protein SAY87_015335 [Trapa incisa]|uniref:Uncharacterized protein n=1 Tax=Trapa incisa TaxID=236973 RepID=A0AAN7JKX2_9MYRT|nr:hypothetical protein SAY87_015335 [Trapa incisa]
MRCYMWDDNERMILEGIKYKDLEELWRNRSNVEEEEVVVTQMGSLTLLPLSAVPLHMLTSLILNRSDDTEELPLELFRSLSRLRSLEIAHFPRMKSLSVLAILQKVHVRIRDCRMLCYMCDDNKSLILSGMKYKDLELWRRNVEEESSSISTTQMVSLTFVPLSSVPLHMLTSLSLVNLKDKEELPSELFRSLSRLQSFWMSYCHRLKSLCGWWILRYLRSLVSLEIRYCKELDLSSIHQEKDNKAIQGIPNSQTKMKDLILIDLLITIMKTVVAPKDKKY